MHRRKAFATTAKLVVTNIGHFPRIRHPQSFRRNGAKSLICKANDVTHDRALERIMRDHTHASCGRMT